MKTIKPRVLRGVMRQTYNKRTGRYKMARDRKTQVRVECVKARQHRPCSGKQCIYPEGLINAGDEYVRVLDPENPSRMLRGQRIPVVLDYHPDCVPARAHSLVRFIIPMRWRAYTCVDRHGPVTKRLFTSPEAWLLFMDKHYPSMRETWSRNIRFTTAPPYQVGTNCYWSQLFKV